MLPSIAAVRPGSGNRTKTFHSSYLPPIAAGATSYVAAPPTTKRPKSAGAVRKEIAQTFEVDLSVLDEQTTKIQSLYRGRKGRRDTNSRRLGLWNNERSARVIQRAIRCLLASKRATLLQKIKEQRICSCKNRFQQERLEWFNELVRWKRNLANVSAIAIQLWWVRVVDDMKTRAEERNDCLKEEVWNDRKARRAHAAKCRSQRRAQTAARRPNGCSDSVISSSSVVLDMSTSHRSSRTKSYTELNNELEEEHRLQAALLEEQAKEEAEFKRKIEAAKLVEQEKEEAEMKKLQLVESRQIDIKREMQKAEETLQQRVAHYQQEALTTHQQQKESWQHELERKARKELAKRTATASGQTEEYNATKIQSVYRGRLAKRDVTNKKQQVVVSNRSASTIQRAARRWMARTDYIRRYYNVEARITEVNKEYEAERMGWLKELLHWQAKLANKAALRIQHFWLKQQTARAKEGKGNSKTSTAPHGNNTVPYLDLVFGLIHKEAQQQPFEGLQHLISCCAYAAQEDNTRVNINVSNTLSSNQQPKNRSAAPSHCGVVPKPPEQPKQEMGAPRRQPTTCSTPPFNKNPIQDKSAHTAGATNNTLVALTKIAGSDPYHTLMQQDHTGSYSAHVHVNNLSCISPNPFGSLLQHEEVSSRTNNNNGDGGCVNSGKSNGATGNTTTVSSSVGSGGRHTPDEPTVGGIPISRLGKHGRPTPTVQAQPQSSEHRTLEERREEVTQPQQQSSECKLQEERREEVTQQPQSSEHRSQGHREKVAQQHREEAVQQQHPSQEERREEVTHQSSECHQSQEERREEATEQQPQPSEHQTPQQEHSEEVAQSQSAEQHHHSQEERREEVTPDDDDASPLPKPPTGNVTSSGSSVVERRDTPDTLNAARHHSTGMGVLPSGGDINLPGLGALQAAAADLSTSANWDALNSLLQSVHPIINTKQQHGSSSGGAARGTNSSSSSPHCDTDHKFVYLHSLYKTFCGDVKLFPSLSMLCNMGGVLVVAGNIPPQTPSSDQLHKAVDYDPLAHHPQIAQDAMYALARKDTSANCSEQMRSLIQAAKASGGIEKHPYLIKLIESMP